MNTHLEDYVSTANNGNTLIAPESAPNELLERVLVGLDDSQRARVLELVVRLGIEPDDPLWLIAIATSQLQVLVEDAPESWSHLFATFLEEIDQWKHHNLKTLEQMTLEAQAVQGLTTSCEQLQSNVSSLQQTLLLLINDLKQSNQNNQSLTEQFRSLKRDLLMALTTQQSCHPSSKLKTVEKETVLPNYHKLRRSNTRWSVSQRVLLYFASGSFLLFGLQAMQLRRGTEHQVNRLMQEQLIRDCRLSVLPPASEICQSLPTQ